MIKKLFIEPFTDRELSSDLPFNKSCFEKPSTGKRSSASKNYARRYSVQLSNFRDLAIQFNIAKPQVKNLLKYLYLEVSSK